MDEIQKVVQIFNNTNQEFMHWYSYYDLIESLRAKYSQGNEEECQVKMNQKYTQSRRLKLIDGTMFKWCGEYKHYTLYVLFIKKCAEIVIKETRPDVEVKTELGQYEKFGVLDKPQAGKVMEKYGLCQSKTN